MEEQERIQEARDIFTSFLQDEKSHSEMIIKFAYFESRQGNTESVNQILTDAESNTQDIQQKGFFRASKIMISFKLTKDVQGTRDSFTLACQEYPTCKYLWMRFLVFEIQFVSNESSDSNSLDYVSHVWESIYSSTLSNESKVNVGRFYVDFLLEIMAPISVLNRLDIQLALIIKTMPMEKPLPLKKRNSSVASIVSNGNVAKQIKSL